MTPAPGQDDGTGTLNLLVRTRADAEAAVPAVRAVVAGLFALVAVAASLTAASRARRIDPAELLRAK